MSKDSKIEDKQSIIFNIDLLYLKIKKMENKIKFKKGVINESDLSILNLHLHLVEKHFKSFQKNTSQ
jgi:hypothetical protein